MGPLRGSICAGPREAPSFPHFSDAMPDPRTPSSEAQSRPPPTKLVLLRLPVSSPPPLRPFPYPRLPNSGHALCQRLHDIPETLSVPQPRRHPHPPATRQGQTWGGHQAGLESAGLGGGGRAGALHGGALL